MKDSANLKKRKSLSVKSKKAFNWNLNKPKKRWMLNWKKLSQKKMSKMSRKMKKS